MYGQMDRVKAIALQIIATNSRMASIAVTDESQEGSV